MQGNVGMSMGNERVRNITKTRNGFTHGIRKGRKLGEKGSRETIIRNERREGGVCLEKQKKKQQKKEERDFTNAVVVMEIGSKDRNDRNWRK